MNGFPASSRPPRDTRRRSAGRTHALAAVAVTAWWRTFPPGLVGAAQVPTLSRVLSPGRRPCASLRGEAARAAADALTCLRAGTAGLDRDAVMTRLLRAALLGSPGAAAVLAHVLRRLAAEDGRAAELASAWEKPGPGHARRRSVR